LNYSLIDDTELVVSMCVDNRSAAEKLFTTLKEHLFSTDSASDYMIGNLTHPYKSVHNVVSHCGNDRDFGLKLFEALKSLFSLSPSERINDEVTLEHISRTDSGYCSSSPRLQEMPENSSDPDSKLANIPHTGGDQAKSTRSGSSLLIEDMDSHSKSKDLVSSTDEKNSKNYDKSSHSKSINEVTKIQSPSETILESNVEAQRNEHFPSIKRIQRLPTGDQGALSLKPRSSSFGSSSSSEADKSLDEKQFIVSDSIQNDTPIMNKCTDSEPFRNEGIVNAPFDQKQDNVDGVDVEQEKRLSTPTCVGSDDSTKNKHSCELHGLAHGDRPDGWVPDDEMGEKTEKTINSK